MSVATRATSPAPTASWPRSSPRYATPRDPGRPTIGDSTAAHLARLRRARPYAWQRDVADVAGELNEAGDGFRYPIVVLSVPRRGGKSTLTLAVNLDRMDLIGDARCWYTAHTREVAAKLYRDEWVPMLDPLARLYRLRKSQGSEGVHKRRGSSRLQIFAPTARALHSTNADTVTVDEAWAFDADTGEAVEAGIRPAQLTRPWRQLWIVSAGGTIASTWWDRWIGAGEAATPGVALFDFGADPTDPGYDPSDPAVWQRSHPTAGVAFDLEVLAHEWNTRRSDADFERAYLNVWPRPSQAVAAGAGLDPDAWYAAAHPDVIPHPVSAIAVDVAADRSRAAVAVAARDDQGAVVVEVVDARPGIGWLVGTVRDTRRPAPGRRRRRRLAGRRVDHRRAQPGARRRRRLRGVGSCAGVRHVRRPARRRPAHPPGAGRARRRRRRRRPPPARRRLAVVPLEVQRRHLPARRRHPRRLRRAHPPTRRYRRGRRHPGDVHA